MSWFSVVCYNLTWEIIKKHILAGKESIANFGIVTENKNIAMTKWKHKCLYFIDTHFYTLFLKTRLLSGGFADINTELNT